MSRPGAGRKERETAWFALVLAWVAAYVNGVVFLQLAGVAASHMSGNTVTLGVRLLEGHLSEAAVLLTPVPLFVLGVILSVVAIRAGEHSGLRSPLSLILGAEAALLAVYTAYATARLRRSAIVTHVWWQTTLLIALPTVAMGVQSGLVSKVAGMRVRTTYITGILTDLAEDAVELAGWFRARTKGHSRRRRWLALRVLPRQRTWTRMLLLAGVWAIFFVGALCGAYAETRIHALALIAPIVALLALAVVEMVDPTERPTRTQRRPS